MPRPPAAPGALDRLRPRVIRFKVLTAAEAARRDPYVPEPLPRRSECRDGARPCPLVRCRYNLYLDVTGPQSIRFTWRHLAPWRVPPEVSCTLDLAEDGPHTLDEVGRALNVTRERARQLEQQALRAAARAAADIDADGSPARVAGENLTGVLPLSRRSTGSGCATARSVDRSPGAETNGRSNGC